MSGADAVILSGIVVGAASGFGAAVLLVEWANRRHRKSLARDAHIEIRLDGQPLPFRSAR